MTEWGGTAERPRKRDNWWYRTFLDETPPDEGMIIRVGKRPKTKKNQDPFPTFRAVQRNPAGAFWAKFKQGKILVETEEQFMDRWKFTRDKMRERDEEKARKKNKK